MTPPPPPQYDLGWMRANVAAVLLACLAAAAALTVRAMLRPVVVGDRIPLDAGRIGLAAERINPNTATVASLQRLPGVGPVRARDIAAWRQAHPGRPFRTPEDLAAVKGIGPVTVQRIAALLEFPGSAPASGPKAP